MAIAKVWDQALAGRKGIPCAGNDDGTWWWTNGELSVLMAVAPPAPITKQADYLRQVLALIREDMEAGELLPLGTPVEVESSNTFDDVCAIYQPADGQEYGLSRWYAEYLQHTFLLELFVIKGKPFGYPVLALDSARKLCGVVMPCRTRRQMAQIKAGTLVFDWWPGDLVKR